MSKAADLALCTTAGTAGCTTAGSCCAKANDAASGTQTVSTAMICIPAGTAINGPLDTKTQLVGMKYTGAATKVYALAACAKVAAGASTLAVSAAAAATAVYMM